MTGPPHLLLELVRRLRRRERGYLAGVLGAVGEQVEAAGRSLRGVQDGLWPFPRPSAGLAGSLRQRTGWLLEAPLAVGAGGEAASPAIARSRVAGR